MYLSDKRHKYLVRWQYLRSNIDTESVQMLVSFQKYVMYDLFSKPESETRIWTNDVEKKKNFKISKKHNFI